MPDQVSNPLDNLIFAKSLAKVMESSDLADSGNITYLDVQALLGFFDKEILLEAHLERYTDIVKSVTFNDVLDVDTANPPTNENAFNQYLLIAVAKKAYNRPATKDTAGFTTLEGCIAKLNAFLLLPVSPGFGSTWYNKVKSYVIGKMAFKVKVVLNSDNTTYTFSESTPDTDSDYVSIQYWSHPNHGITDDFATAKAIRENISPKFLLRTDLTNGVFGVRAAIMLTTGLDAATADLSTVINSGAKVLAFTNLVTKSGPGGLLGDIQGVNPAGNTIALKYIGDAAMSDQKIAEGIAALSDNASFAYAHADANEPSTLIRRSVDFVGLPVFQYHPVVSKVIDWITLTKKPLSRLAKIYLNDDADSSIVHETLRRDALTVGGVAAERTAKYYTTSALTTAVPANDVVHPSVYIAVLEALKTSPLDVLTLNTPIDLANYFSNNGTANNVIEAPVATTSFTNGINANLGYFNTYMSAVVSSSSPLNCDLVFDAVKIVAEQNNKDNGTFTHIYQIISTWFQDSSVVSQVPTTVPATSATSFWDIPESGVYTETHARRLLANYIFKTYNIRLLADPKNKPIYDLLFKTGTNTGSNVNALQATNIYAFNQNLITSNIPNPDKIGSAEEVFEIVNSNPDLSIFTKVRLFCELKYGVVNSSDELMGLVAQFGKEVIYSLPEVPMKKDSVTPAIATANATNTNNSFSDSSNIPTGSGGSLYATFTSNTAAHQALVRSNKVIAVFMDIYREVTIDAVEATRTLELAKSAPNFVTQFLRFAVNFNSRTKALFTDVIQRWLVNGSAAELDKIVINQYIYGDTVKSAITKYISADSVNTTLTLALGSKALASAADTLTSGNTALFTPAISYAVQTVANLAIKLLTKEPNTDVNTTPDARLKLSDFTFTAGKQDVTFVCLIAAGTDGSADPTKLNDKGKNDLLEAGLSISDIAQAVVSKNARTNPWEASMIIKFFYLLGLAEDGNFVSDKDK